MVRASSPRTVTAYRQQGKGMRKNDANDAAAIAAKTAGHERAIFKLFSLGVVTNRDEWVMGSKQEHALKVKVYFDCVKANKADRHSINQH